MYIYTYTARAGSTPAHRSSGDTTACRMTGVTLHGVEVCCVVQEREKLEFLVGQVPVFNKVCPPPLTARCRL